LAGSSDGPCEGREDRVGWEGVSVGAGGWAGFDICVRTVVYVWGDGVIAAAVGVGLEAVGKVEVSVKCQERGVGAKKIRASEDRWEIGDGGNLTYNQSNRGTRSFGPSIPSRCDYLA